MNIGKIVFSLFFIVLTVVPGAQAQSGDEIKNLKKEIEALKKNQNAIIRELNAIKKRAGNRVPPLRLEPPVPQNVVLSIKGEPYKGSENAKLTLIEFSDYQCPFCARHVKNTLPRLEREYILTGKLKYVFRDFPIPQLHPQAPKAHEAANCSKKQNQYWKFHDILFQNRKSLPISQLKKFAQSLGLDMEKFNKCLNGGKEAAEVEEDRADGQKAAVRGTPTFFLGYTAPNGGDIKSANRIVGAQPYARFKAAIDSLLAKKK